MTWLLVGLVVGAVVGYLVAKKADFGRWDWGVFWFVTGASMAVFGLIGYFASGYLPDYSEGERVGYVTKMSTKGFIWKTNEGQMQMGQGEQVAIQAPFEFSVKDAAVEQKLKDAMISGKKVKVQYREWLMMSPRTGESGYEIIAVTEIK